MLLAAADGAAAVAAVAAENDAGGDVAFGDGDDGIVGGTNDMTRLCAVADATDDACAAANCIADACA